MFPAEEISEKAITPVRAKHSADNLWLSAKVFARMLRPYDLRVSIFLEMARPLTRNEACKYPLMTLDAFTLVSRLTIVGMGKQGKISHPTPFHVPF